MPLFRFFIFFGHNYDSLPVLTFRPHNYHDRKVSRHFSLKTFEVSQLSKTYPILSFFEEVFSKSFFCLKDTKNFGLPEGLPRSELKDSVLQWLVKIKD